MATFLKIVSGFYLILVWLVFAAAISASSPPLNDSIGMQAAKFVVFLIAVGLSIPAAVLFGFAQIVGDIRAMRNNARVQLEHLKAVRRYYEPNT
jgi:hypothetical protein